MTTVDVVSGAATFRGRAGPHGCAFLGLRYAEAPVGALRFAAPLPHRPAGIVDATRPGHAPPQHRRPPAPWSPRIDVETGEDCLNLNVFTPGPGGRRPVVVHVFGGGFQTGSASSGGHDDGAFAAAGDVVLVRPNLRTGALGFLHLGGATPANRGLLDLVEALRWVRTHIDAFGGDPGRVTLLGLSSGAFTIAALFGMEGAADLFDRAWLMSGSASRIVDAATAGAIGHAFLRRAGLDAADRQGLEALPVETVLQVQEQIVATDLGERNAPGGRTLGIVHDGTSLVRHPLDGLASGAFAHKQLVLGWTRDEARAWYASGVMARPADRARVLATVRRFGPESALAALEAETPPLDLAALEERFLTRTIYRDPALRTAAAHAGAGGCAWTYEFAWENDGPFPALGAAHGLDEPFVFGNPGRLGEGSRTAARLATEMNGSLFRFAATGEVDWPSSAGPETVKRFR